MARFILEGTWTGYTSAQSRVCHREILTEKRAQSLGNLHKIVFTDNTSLLISIRKAQSREKIVPLNQYGELILDAERRGGSVLRVADLADEQQAKSA